MPQIITVNSFRRAVGRSSLVANLGTLLARRGLRVGVIDADFQGPCQHLLFDLDARQIQHTLNDFLWGKCAITEVSIDISKQVKCKSPGKLILVPASTDVNDVLRILRAPFDVDRFNEGLRQLSKAHQLDFILLDTSAGLNENTLLSMALANSLIIMLRPDKQDYQGTAVTIEVAQGLGAPCQYIIMNETPHNLDIENARKQLETTYQCQVGALLPHSEALASLASGGILAVEVPVDPYIKQLKEMADKIAEKTVPR